MGIVDRVEKREARSILQELLDELRERPYSELAKLIGDSQQREITGESGTRYQVEMEAVWDDKREGNLRVVAAIDDGGWRAFVPLTDSFIISPDGSFVGE
jgi:hypothetical protein